MPGTQGYAVVSCHVERVNDDRVWERYSALLRRRPGGIPIASLLRPPASGEDVDVWLERAREAASLAPYGHHIHWTSPTHARPTAGDPAERVREEGAWFRAAGLEPRFFCGGGWYTDASVAEAVADLGYVECTALAWRPSYLGSDEAWVELAQPAWVQLPSGRDVLTIPTTHSFGMLARAITKPLPPVVHMHFHDYELLDRRRAAALSAALRALAFRRRPIALGEVASAVETRWADVWRGVPA
jgi:hypothetical protein